MTLPGGWVDLPLAAALAAAGVTVWQQRRHRHHPAPLATPITTDPDQRPLPRAATMMRVAVRTHAPNLLEPAPTGPTAAAYATDPDPTRLPPPAPTGTDLTGLAHTNPCGVGLTGSGAYATARALLIATLATGHATDPAGRGQVIIPADTYTTLLGTTATATPPIPRLTVTKDLAAALTQIEETIIHRRRILADENADTIDDLPDIAAIQPSMPPIVLIADTPTSDASRRLASTIQLSSPLRITTVLLGAWPTGETLTITDDGTYSPDTATAATLDTATTIDLLHMLAEAHTSEPTPTPPEPERNIITAEQTAGNAPVKGATTGAAAESPTPVGKVQLTVLGTPAVLDTDGKPIPGLRSGAGQLMVYLAIARHPAPFTEIMAAFWPDAHVPEAKDRLFTEVSDLRRYIRKAAGNRTIQPVPNLGQRYHLDPNIVDVDIWNITTSLRAAAAATDPTTKIDALKAAVNAHTGVLAEHADWDGIEAAREAIRRHGLTARLHLAELLAPSNPDHATQLINDATDIDPYNETVAQHAMRTYAKLHNAQAIQAQLERLRTALHELGTQPTTETIDLADDLIREANQPDGQDEADA